MTMIDAEPSADPRLRSKTTGRLYDPWEPFRRTLLATGEFYRGLAEASAESFRVFSAALDTPQVETHGLTCSFLEGLAQGNAQFYETMGRSSRRVADYLRPEPVVRPVAEEIDYERLARLVAIELKKFDPQVGP